MIGQDGKEHKLMDHGMTIVGNSKSYDATSSEKFGAMLTGNIEYRAKVSQLLPTLFQRESTHLARALLENTPNSYIAEKKNILFEYQNKFRGNINTLNDKYREVLDGNAFNVLGKSPYGLFSCLELTEAMAAKCGVNNSIQMRDFLFSTIGINSVPGVCMGINDKILVRLNIAFPRMQGIKHHDNMQNVIARLDQLIEKVIYQGIKYSSKMI